MKKKKVLNNKAMLKRSKEDEKENIKGYPYYKDADPKQSLEKFNEVTKSEVKRSKKEGFYKRWQTK